MNIYDRIINILLEARIEDYLDRLDEVGNKANRQKVKAWMRSQIDDDSEDGSSPDFQGRLNVKFDPTETKAGKAHHLLNQAGKYRRKGLKNSAENYLRRSKEG